MKFLKFIGSLLKMAFAVAIGIFVFIFMVLGLVWLFSPSEEKSIAAKSVLRLTFGKTIKERGTDNPLAEVGVGDESMGLVELKANIRKAQKDKNIEGIFLNLSGVGAGFATIEEIRNTLIEYKKSGKFLYAYSELLTEGGYYLASVSDKIYLNPRGMMELNGLSAQYTFYKGSMEKLEVKPEIFRVGEFKSAVEPFLLDKMSEANREQTASFLNSIYNYVLKNIANARKISVVELRRISDEFLVRKPEDALKYKLVTHLAYYDEVEAEMKKKLGLKEKDKINFVNHNEYEKVPATEKEKYSENKIAVIIGEGDIQSGNSTDESIGSETIAQEIRRARLDKNIKAIVLRINSPGGSALASDVMWREVIEAKKVKPVIASMSDVAASGGYYMAMGCDAIVAQPTTITGSIGIFGMLFNAEGLYKNKLGMSSDRVSTGKFADIRSAILDRSLTEQEREMIQNWVNEGYEDFTAKAAKGRKMSHEDLKKVASGRVWSGVEAKERGLVDKLGSFEDAIVLAAEKAKLKKGEYRLRYYPAQKTFVEKVTELLNAEAKAEKLLNEKLGALYPALQILEKMKRQEVMQARMGFEMEIR